MLEVELKSVVDDVRMRRAAVEAAGGVLVFAGSLTDRRYDMPDRSLTARDHVLRVRVYRGSESTRAEMSWKGATRRENGYKLREELEAPVVGDADALVAILERLGYIVTMVIEREIAQYDLEGTMIRFEHYPRMDDLVEVEGTPDAIEHAIRALGMPREDFTSDRLPDFAARFEQRTGMQAALSHGAFAGMKDFDVSNA